MTRSAQHPVQEMLHVLQEAKSGLSAFLERDSSRSKTSGSQIQTGSDILRLALEATEVAYSTHPFVWPHLMGPRLHALQQAAAFLAKHTAHRDSPGPPASLPLIRTLLGACSAILRTWPHRGRWKAKRTAKRLDRLVAGIDSVDSAASAVEAAQRLITEIVPRPALEQPPPSAPAPSLVPSSLLSAAPLRSAPG